jgi:hypothetical protein
LTGAPAESYLHDQPARKDELFIKLKNADKKNSFLTASSKGQGEGDLGDGIIQGHAYSVITVTTVKTKSQKEEKIL